MVRGLSFVMRALIWICWKFREQNSAVGHEQNIINMNKDNQGRQNPCKKESALPGKKFLVQWQTPVRVNYPLRIEDIRVHNNESVPICPLCYVPWNVREIFLVL